MSSLSQALISAKKLFKETGIPSFSLDAELLLAHTLDKSREFVLGRPEYELSEDAVARYEGFIKRRQNREPVAKIIGKKEFWSREFSVNSSTLDPRPDSETIIEAVLELYPDRNSEFKVIDFGTGSGCLLLTILAEYPNSLGVGVDVERDTLDMAISNAAKLGLAKRSEFILNNWAEGMEGQFELIISNPPYIKNSDIKELEPEVSAHEPYKALAGGEDGLDCYRLLAPQMKNLLKQNGHLIFEFGMGQENCVREICELSGFSFVSFKNDLAGIPRCIVVSN